MNTAGTTLGALVLAFFVVVSSVGCATAQENTNVRPNQNTSAVNSNEDDRADLEDRSKEAAAELKRLTDLQAALAEIPFNGEKTEPHATLIKKHEDEIVYNEPAGQWIVKSEKFWDLAEKYKDLPIADDIAWTAAENPVPGECEGYVPCALYWMRITSGEYLKRIPNGKHRDAAMENVSGLLSDLAENPGDEGSGTWPSEEDERADYKKSLDELSAIIEKTDGPRKETVLRNIRTLLDVVK